MRTIFEYKFLRSGGPLSGGCRFACVFCLTFLALGFLNFGFAEGKRGCLVEDNIFSPPESSAKEAPQYVGKNGQKLEHRDSKDVRIEQIKEIPSLSPQQRKDIEKIDSDCRTKVQSMREELRSLRLQLKAAQEPTQQVDALEELQGKIQTMEQDIETHNKEAVKSCLDKLDEKQLDLLDRMRHGELIIKNDSAIGKVGKQNPEPEKPKKSLRQGGTSSLGSSFVRRLLLTGTRQVLLRSIRGF